MGHNIWCDYCDWLVEQLHFNDKGYENLIEDLHNTPFEVILDRDNDRIGDAEGLRKKYLNGYGITGDFKMLYPIGILEVLTALAIRIDAEYIGNPADPQPNIIFWEMLCNLGLDKYDNRHFNGDYINEIVYVFINRMYDFNGYGGLFPLKNPRNDQKNVEIWSQMKAYLSENYG